MSSGVETPVHKTKITVMLSEVEACYPERTDPEYSGELMTEGNNIVEACHPGYRMQDTG